MLYLKNLVRAKHSSGLNADCGEQILQLPSNPYKASFTPGFKPLPVPVEINDLTSHPSRTEDDINSEILLDKLGHASIVRDSEILST